MRASRYVPGLAAAAALLAASAPAWASHAGPLRGQWHLDENPAVAGQKMLDSSGHGLDGDPYETILSVSGRFGQGVEIPDDLEITVIDNALLEPQRVSLLAWVKGSAPGAFQTIIAKGGDDGCTASSYALDTSSAGGIEFYVRGGSNARFSTPAADRPARSGTARGTPWPAPTTASACGSSWTASRSGDPSRGRSRSTTSGSSAS